MMNHSLSHDFATPDHHHQEDHLLASTLWRLETMDGEHHINAPTKQPSLRTLAKQLKDCVGGSQTKIFLQKDGDGDRSLLARKKPKPAVEHALRLMV